MNFWILNAYHACNHVINGTINIYLCPENFNASQEEVDKREYYDCKWQKKKKMKMDALFLKCAEKRYCFESFARFLFAQDVNKKKRML